MYNKGHVVQVGMQSFCILGEKISTSPLHNTCVILASSWFIANDYQFIRTLIFWYSRMQITKAIWMLALSLMNDPNIAVKREFCFILIYQKHARRASLVSRLSPWQRQATLLSYAPVSCLL